MKLLGYQAYMPYLTETEQPKEERIIEMDVQRLRYFRNHPFKIRDDAQFKQLTESISRYGKVVAKTTSVSF